MVDTISVTYLKLNTLQLLQTFKTPQLNIDGKRVDKKDDDDAADDDDDATDGGKEKKHEIGTDFGLKTDQVTITKF